MIKQALGNDYWAIGGKPADVIPLFTSLLNWKGINCKKHLRNNPVAFLDTECNDLGDKDNFVYFEIRLAKYQAARKNAFVNSLDFPKGTMNAWEIVGSIVAAEWNDIKEEDFLGLAVVSVPCYGERMPEVESD